MSWTDILDRLSALAGIEPRYYDLTGVRHETTIESKVLVLSALGFDVSSIAAACASLAGLQEDAWRRALSPCIVTRAKSPLVDLFLSAEHANRLHKWVLLFEQGGSLNGEFRPESLSLMGTREIDGRRIEHRRLSLEHAQPAGYHTIALHSAASTPARLVLVPDAAYLPPSLAIAEQRLWGTAAHLYTLRSLSNWGIGDFGDLARLCRMVGSVGGSAIALNPFHALFPDRPEDASPYSPSSRLFLNPLYVGGDVLAGATGADPGPDEDCKALRAADFVDYGGVWRVKSAALEAGYARFRHGPQSSEYLDFVREQGAALERFALFSTLAEEYGRPWRDWPADVRRPDALSSRNPARNERCEFHRWVQFVADRQLGDAAAEAAAAGMEVGIVRDLAMGINPDGADAWMDQESYVSGLRCGAPSDDFHPRGQEWGILPQNPVRLRRNIMPFADLLRANMRHAGGLRIDHIIGLQRQFLVPLGAEPSIGCYLRFPMDELLGVLALESCRNRCLVIGEDLGTVPEGFRERMQDADILTCAVFYFERTAEGRFKPPRDYRRKSAASVATHDLPPFAGYWDGSDIELRKYLGIYAETDAREALARREFDRACLLDALQLAGFPVSARDGDPLTASQLRRAVHAFLASSSAQLFLAKLDDLLDERAPLNVPGTTMSVPNWRRKLPSALDGPVLAAALDELARVCAEQGRSPRGGAQPFPRADSFRIGSAPQT